MGIRQRLEFLELQRQYADDDLQHGVRNAVNILRMHPEIRSGVIE